MAYKGSDYYCDDSIVLRAMKEAKKTGVILMVHAESADLTDSLEICSKFNHSGAAQANRLCSIFFDCFHALFI